MLLHPSSVHPSNTWGLAQDDEIETKLALEAFLPVSEVQAGCRFGTSACSGNNSPDLARFAPKC